MLEALSRRPKREDLATYGLQNSYSSVSPTWMANLIASYDKDVKAKELIYELSLDELVVPKSTLKEGMYVGAATTSRQKLLEIYHA